MSPKVTGASRPSPDLGIARKDAAGGARRKGGRALGPLDQDDGVWVVEAELIGVAFGEQPVEVGVEDAEVAALVGLDQREGGRGYIEGAGRPSACG